MPRFRDKTYKNSGDGRGFRWPKEIVEILNSEYYFGKITGKPIDICCYPTSGDKKKIAEYIAEYIGLDPNDDKLIYRITNWFQNKRDKEMRIARDSIQDNQETLVPMLPLSFSSQSSQNAPAYIAPRASTERLPSLDELNLRAYANLPLPLQVTVFDPSFFRGRSHHGRQQQPRPANLAIEGSCPQP